MLKAWPSGVRSCQSVQLHVSVASMASVALPVLAGVDNRGMTGGDVAEPARTVGRYVS